MGIMRRSTYIYIDQIDSNSCCSLPQGAHQRQEPADETHQDRGTLRSVRRSPKNEAAQFERRVWMATQERS